jgi:acetoin utilization protein AcuB
MPTQVKREAPIRTASNLPERLTAGRVMTTPVVVCGPDESLARAVELLQRSGTRHVVVCDEHDHVIGVVNDRRLALALGRMSWSELSMPLSEIMDRAVCRAHSDESLHRVARRVEFSPSDCVVITGEDSRLLGLVTPAEIVRAVAHQVLKQRRDTTTEAGR